MIGALILLCPPFLAIYSLMMRNKAMKNGHLGYIYNGKLWVTWLAVIDIFACLFLMFGAPLIAGPVEYTPDWEKIKVLIFGLIEYISYVLVSYRPATAEEIEEAEASGQSAIKMTAKTSTSMLMGILACVGAVICSIPSLIYHALNPVQAIKVIGGVTYKVIGTGFSAVMGGIIGLGILAALVAGALLIGSALIAIFSMLILGTLAIIKFFINMKESKKDENGFIKFFRNKV